MSILDDGSNFSILVTLLALAAIGGLLGLLNGFATLDRVLAEFDDDEPLPQVCDCDDCCAWYYYRPDAPAGKKWYRP